MPTVPVWETAAEKTVFPPLQQNITVDVAVIGGGITGITTAYLLSKGGKRVAVLEAGSIAGSTTGHSTGNLYATVGGAGLQAIQSKWGVRRLKQVVQSRLDAVNFIESTIKELKIDCDFQRVPWCLFAEKEGDKTYVQNERLAAELAGLQVSDNVSFDFDTEAGFVVPGQAQFNPLQYTQALARKIQSPQCMIFQNTKVTAVADGAPCVVTTGGGTVTANQVVMATHTPKGIFLVHTSLGCYREHAIAARLNGSYPSAGIFWNKAEKQQYSIRTYKTPKETLLLALGQAYKTGTTQNTNEYFFKMEAYLRKRFSVAAITNQWAAQQYRPADGLPYIGISSGSQNVYIATGFAADGLTYGTVAAMIISDEILTTASKWSSTYSASRLTPVASFTNFVKENAGVAATLVEDYLAKNKTLQFSEIAKNEGKIMTIDGKKCAVHKDDDGNVHVVAAVCTHMGCIVHWNQAEKSWDCPCHGSRFTPDGDVLEGPALKPLKKMSQ